MSENLGLPDKIEELEDKYKRDPASRVFAQLGEEYRKVNRFEEAILVCNDGLKRNPTYHSARVTLARAYLAVKKLDLARSELERVIAAAPDNIVANRVLGDLYYEQGERREALARYRVVQMLNPNDDEVTTRLSRLEQGDAAPVETGEGFADLRMDEAGLLPGESSGAMRIATDRPPAVEPPLEVGDELGEMGLDDFSDFSSPTVMLSTKDIAAAIAASPPASEKPVAAAKPPVPPPVVEAKKPLSDFAARAGQKFGLSRYGEAKTETPEPAPRPVNAPPPPAPVAARVETASPAPVDLDSEFGGELGMDEFSEFAAPTVMMNVHQLIAGGAAAPPPPGGPEPAARPASTPALPPAGLAPPEPPLAESYDSFGTRAISVESLRDVLGGEPGMGSVSGEAETVPPSASDEIPAVAPGADDPFADPEMNAVADPEMDPIADPFLSGAADEPFDDPVAPAVDSSLAPLADAPLPELAPAMSADAFADLVGDSLAVENADSGYPADGPLSPALETPGDPFAAEDVFASSPFAEGAAFADEPEEAFAPAEDPLVAAPEEELAPSEARLAAVPSSAFAPAEDPRARAGNEAFAPAESPLVAPEQVSAAPAPVVSAPAEEAVPAIVARPEPAEEPGGEDGDERKRKIQKLSNWLSSLRKP